MTLRAKRPAGPGIRRTAVATAVALAFAGAVTGVGTAFGSTADVASHGHPVDRNWLPDTPENWPLVVDYTRTPAETVTRGLQHYGETYDTVGGRQHIQVLKADLSDPNLRVGVVEADTVTDPQDETPSSMAHRTHAVVASTATTSRSTPADARSVASSPTGTCSRAPSRASRPSWASSPTAPW